VLAQQVVRLVAARRGLGDQVLVIQLLQMPAGHAQAGAVESGSGVAVDAWAGYQAESAEEPLLAGGQLSVGQVEGGGDPHALGAHEGEPLAGRDKLGDQLLRRPRPTAPAARLEQAPAAARPLSVGDR
jgi:hypothetical protein